MHPVLTRSLNESKPERASARLPTHGAVGARGLAVVCWAVLGVAGLLLEPAIRLAVRATSGLSSDLRAIEWLVLGSTLLAIGYVEGYRGFRCSFCPRVIERAFELGRSGRPVHRALAPLYAMSLIGDTRARIVRAWTIVGLVLVCMLAVRHLPASGRAMVDLSCAVSLLWGAAEVLVRCALHWRGSTAGAT